MIHIIENGGTVEQAKQAFANKHIDPMAIEWAEEKIPEEKCLDRMRLYYYIGKVTGGKEGERYLEKSFRTLRNGIFDVARANIRSEASVRIVKESVKINLPLRVNFGGGWSDTPPYCNEHGGTVLNAAIKVNGILPVEAELKRIDEKGIRLSSSDIGVSELFSDIATLQNCTDPYDSFALHKAVLLAAGIIPFEGGSLGELMSGFGGGFELSTRMINIPKGSGLGTSSILAGACVKGISDFFGLEFSEDRLYETVLCAEQLMSTGGGWQDQVGGLTDGMKLITTKPGMVQEIKCTPVDISSETLGELSERFAIIYTGQRRLARNLLHEVVGKYIGARPESVKALGEIQRSAALMRFELERGNVDAFAGLMTEHWELSKMLDMGCTNTCIDQIFNSVDDMLSGKMICGAGGGGFLQVVLKKGVTKECLRDRLIEVFQDSGVDVWSCEFV
jgi:fucokinase